MNGLNGKDLVLVPSEIDGLVAKARAAAWHDEYRNVLQERETLTIRHRVQQRVRADQAVLKDLADGLEKCELAIMELRAIAKEYGILGPEAPGDEAGR
jgi:hypothetical protein